MSLTSFNQSLNQSGANLSALDIPIPPLPRQIHPEILKNGFEDVDAKFAEIKKRIDDIMESTRKKWKNKMDTEKEQRRRIANLQEQLRKAKEELAAEEADYQRVKREEEAKNASVAAKSRKIRKKLAQAEVALRDWNKLRSHNLNKLKNAQEEEAKTNAVLDKLGLSLLCENGENGFTGLRLNKIDSLDPEAEFIVRFLDFDTADWSFKEVLNVEPLFPEAEEVIKQANENKDILFVIHTCRKHWGVMCAPSPPPPNTLNFATPERQKQTINGSILMFDEDD